MLFFFSTPIDFISAMKMHKYRAKANMKEKNISNVFLKIDNKRMHDSYGIVSRKAWCERIKSK